MKLVDLGVSKKQSSAWQSLARLERERFESVIAARQGEALRALDGSRGERQAEKKERRATREASLAAKIAALPEQKFGVIYADPEWRFEVYSEAGLDRSAKNHYPCSGVETICARPVGEIAADDCVLFLWVTRPCLPQGLAVMAAWGSDYKSCCAWRKTVWEPATGFATISNCC